MTSTRLVTRPATGLGVTMGAIHVAPVSGSVARVRPMRSMAAASLTKSNSSASCTCDRDEAPVTARWDEHMPHAGCRGRTRRRRAPSCRRAPGRRGQKGSEGVRRGARRGPKESEGVRRSQKESKGVRRGPKKSEGVRRSRKESEGVRRSRKESEGVRRDQEGSRLELREDGVVVYRNGLKAADGFGEGLKRGHVTEQLRFDGRPLHLRARERALSTALRSCGEAVEGRLWKGGCGREAVEGRAVEGMLWKGGYGRGCGRKEV